jgi:hypothetical protein
MIFYMIEHFHKSLHELYTQVFGYNILEKTLCELCNEIHCTQAVP